MSVELKKGRKRVHEMSADCSDRAKWVWCRVTGADLNYDTSREETEHDDRNYGRRDRNMTVQL